MKLAQDTFSGKCLRTPLRQGRLSHHGVKEKYQPLYQKLVLTMARPAGFEPTAFRLGDEKSVRLGMPANVPQVLDITGFLTISGRSHFLQKTPLLP